MKLFLIVSPFTIVNLLLWPFKVASLYVQRKILKVKADGLEKVQLCFILGVNRFHQTHDSQLLILLLKNRQSLYCAVRNSSSFTTGWHMFTANCIKFKQMQLWKDFGLNVGGCVSWAFQIENNWPESNILLKQPRTYLRKNHWPFRTFLRHRKLNPVLFPKQFKMSSWYPFHCPPAPCTVCCNWI